MSKGSLFSVPISAIIFYNFISFFGPKIQSICTNKCPYK